MAQNTKMSISLEFTSNTAKVKKDLSDLKKQLQTLSTSSTKGMSLDEFNKGGKESIATLNQMNAILQKSTNDLGKLNLNTFTNELNKAGLKLSEVQERFSQLGKGGDEAFSNLAESIANAEVPLTRSIGLVDKLVNQMKNVAQYQLTTGLYRELTGALSEAYNYAQDLNKSLTNIQIVTGHSSDYMSQFAERANKAAKELSMSTTAYTDAALIFYQQGEPHIILGL